jgi:hypothetical protein
MQGVSDIPGTRDFGSFLQAYFPGMWEYAGEIKGEANGLSGFFDKIWRDCAEREKSVFI